MAAAHGDAAQVGVLLSAGAEGRLARGSGAKPDSLDDPKPIGRPGRAAGS